MPIHNVDLITNAGTFRGLAKQNILFHQCLAELIDNSIAATSPQSRFKIDIIFGEEVSKGVIELYLVDNCEGMSLETLSKALQLGESATTDNRLNEHGFGLKNSLATLSDNNGWWKLWTQEKGSSRICEVEGPFEASMVINDEGAFPENPLLPPDFSTVVCVRVKTTFIQTVQGSGRGSNDLSNLRRWLVEHLGVLYRGYLEQDEDGETSGVITVHVGKDSKRVLPVRVPLGKSDVRRLNIELRGAIYPIEFRFGSLDEAQRDRLVGGEKSRYYYQGNQQKQGVDIRIGKRTIATFQFDSIWKELNGTSQLQRHPSFNDFVGEILIPDLPRGVLTTVNNKTDFNLDDDGWIHIFDEINKIRPPKQIKLTSEKELRDKWATMLSITNREDEVSTERQTWPMGTRVDVHRKKSNGKIIIYELKTGTGSASDLYQLKMYWDGLVLYNKEPVNKAVLICNQFDAKLQEMANLMNTLPTLPGSEPYDFTVETLKDNGLI